MQAAPFRCLQRQAVQLWPGSSKNTPEFISPDHDQVLNPETPGLMTSSVQILYYPCSGNLHQGLVPWSVSDSIGIPCKAAATCLSPMLPAGLPLLAELCLPCNSHCCLVITAGHHRKPLQQHILCVLPRHNPAHTFACRQTCLIDCGSTHQDRLLIQGVQNYMKLLSVASVFCSCVFDGRVFSLRSLCLQRFRECMIGRYSLKGNLIEAIIS